ncbi:MAG: nitroreductase family protein [Silvibacterium sp.]|nr:nitroreductase family protein [Silvibacterium sp.]MBV8436566.1 nitroreductase family protein [Silvibacterium sp.]
MSHTTEEIEKLKHAPAVPGVIEVILERWSPRAFSAKPVSREHLRKIFEAARWAASSYNEQPWRFIVGHKGDPTYQKIFESLVAFNQSWAASAPVLILSAASKTFAHNGAPNRFAIHDTGAATAFIALQATALGLHTHSMAGFDPDKARAAFDIPDSYHIGAVTALGHLGDADNLPEGLLERELAPRDRKALSEIVLSDWGHPAKL